MLRKLTLASVTLLFTYCALVGQASAAVNDSGLHKNPYGQTSTKNSEKISKKQGRHCVKLGKSLPLKCHS